MLDSPKISHKLLMKTLFSHNLVIVQNSEQVHSTKAVMYDFNRNTKPDLRINLPQTPLPDSPFFRLLAILLTIYGRDIKFNVFIIHQTNMSVAEMWNRCEDESEEKNSSRWWFPVVKTIERYKRKHNLRFTWYGVDVVLRLSRCYFCNHRLVFAVLRRYYVWCVRDSAALGDKCHLISGDCLLMATGA